MPRWCRPRGAAWCSPIMPSNLAAIKTIPEPFEVSIIIKVATSVVRDTLYLLKLNSDIRPNDTWFLCHFCKGLSLDHNITNGHPVIIKNQIWRQYISHCTSSVFGITIGRANKPIFAEETAARSAAVLNCKGRSVRNVRRGLCGIVFVVKVTRDLQ